VPLDACTPKSLTPPATIQSSLTTASCLDTVIDSYEDIYNLNATAGTTVIIDYSSSNYDVFLYMEGVDVDIVSFLDSGVSRQKIVWLVGLMISVLGLAYFVNGFLLLF
jgi:hypothetical protein